MTLVLKLGFGEVVSLLSHRQPLGRARKIYVEASRRDEDSIELKSPTETGECARRRPPELDAFFKDARAVLERKFSRILKVDHQLDPLLKRLMHLVSSERFCTGSWNAALEAGDLEAWLSELGRMHSAANVLAHLIYSVRWFGSTVRWH